MIEKTYLSVLDQDEYKKYLYWKEMEAVEKVECREAQKIERKSDGFCGYDWMIKSIIKYGEIRYERDWE